MFSFSGVTGSAVSVGEDCRKVHPGASDCQWEQKNTHLTLGKSITLQHDRSNETNSSVITDGPQEDEKRISLHLELDSDGQNGNVSDEKQENVSIGTVQTPHLGDDVAIVAALDNSDSGSIISLASSFNDVSSTTNSKTEDGDSSSVKSKKRRSFFNFRRSKKEHKKEVIL